MNFCWTDDNLDSAVVFKVAERLGRQPSYVDGDGYLCELIGAAVRSSDEFAYVETRRKDIGYNQYAGNQRHIDVSIRIHLISPSAAPVSTDVKSYNPFFGCRISLFHWLCDEAILIYEEKHSTYACAFGNAWPPRFVKIEYRWQICDNALAYRDRDDEIDLIHRLSVPAFDPMTGLARSNADSHGCLPPEFRVT